ASEARGTVGSSQGDGRMNGHPTNEDREALIAGDRAGSLAPGEADELALLADLLGDPSTWTDPPAGLEDAIVQRVEEAPRPSEHGSAPASTSATQPVAERARPRRRRVAWLAAPAAAAIAAVIAVAALTGPSTSADFSATLTATAAAPSARATARITKT